MRFMLGFTRAQADEYAKQWGWRRWSSGTFLDEHNAKVVHVVGDRDEDAKRLAGLEVRTDDGIIWGPGHVTPHVCEVAISKARL